MKIVLDLLHYFSCILGFDMASSIIMQFSIYALS